LDHFDVLVKQFISTVPSSKDTRNQLRADYLNLKRNADFSRAHPRPHREHLQMFMEERKRGDGGTSIAEHQRPLTVDTTLDLGYMDSEYPVGRWDPDKEARLSPNSDNRDHDCVRCVCGMAEDDGVMTQCDKCHFWLHADCLDSPITDDQVRQLIQ
jgi:hypothetical protein